MAARSRVHAAEASTRSGSSREKLASDDSACVIIFASDVSGGATEVIGLTASPAFAARYPARARTCTPGRFTRTVILWNFPSASAVE